MTTKRHTNDNNKATEPAPRPTNMHGAHVRTSNVDEYTRTFFKEKVSDLEGTLRKRDESIKELMETVALAALDSHRLGVKIEQLSKELDTIRKENEHLKRFAYVDEATGLEKVEVFNNMGFPKAFGTAMRHDLNLVLIMIDLNDLKKTNDTDSYEAGNRLIAKTADVIKGTIRIDDLRYKLEAGYRWGGDEFLVLAHIPKGTEAEVYANAKALIRRLDDAMVANGVNCSIGACIMTPKEAFHEDKEKDACIIYMEKPSVEHEINLSGADIGMIRDAMFKSAEKEMKMDKAHKKGKHISTLKRE